MRFDVLKAVKVSVMVFWIIMLCHLVDSYPEDRGDMFLQNSGKHLKHHRVLQSGSPQMTSMVCLYYLILNK
jgi:hypothetical protein